MLMNRSSLLKASRSHVGQSLGIHLPWKKGVEVLWRLIAIVSAGSARVLRVAAGTISGLGWLDFLSPGAALVAQADLNWRIVDGLETGDLLAGGAGANRLYGTVNPDLLNGAAGVDTMTGAPGADLYRYLAATEGADSITDFQVGVDKVQVVGTGFANLAVGALSAGNFVSGAAPVANDASAKFLYNTTTGVLSFDADGTGAGVAVQLVTLVGNPALTVADISVA
jgi:Ca2+-binding RTX toxin-like protein